MFGRIMSIEVFDREGNSTFLVDPTVETPLMCSGTIDYLPSSSGAPRATIQVFNLPSILAAPLFAMRKQVLNDEGQVEYLDDTKMVRIGFGYRDENDGELSTIFVGRVARAFTTRQDATTYVTKIYAYQLGDLFTSAVSTARFEAGTSIYDCIDGLFELSTVSGIQYTTPESLKNYFIDSDISFYGKTLDCVNSLLRRVDYMIVTTPRGVNFVPMKPTDADLDCVILGSYDDDGRVVARSGLIGFPKIDSDGIRFTTLINPRITLFSFVWLPNTVLIDNRDGFVPSNQFGASYDPAGLYRVVKMTTKFDSHSGDCNTEYVAVSAATGSQYYK